MISPKVASTFISNPPSGQVYSPTVVPYSQFQFPHDPPHWPNYPHLTFPNPYSNLNTHQAPNQYLHSLYFNQPDNPAYGYDPTNPIEQRQPSTPAQGYNAINPVEQRHDSLTKPGTASTSPDGSVPPGWKGNRIPSNNVPRKAPLAARSSDQLSPTAARKTPKGRPERTVSEPIETLEHITRARVRQQQSFETSSGVSRRGLLQLNDQNQAAAQPPIGFFAPPQVLPSPAPPKPGRLRPRHTYQVPTELAGTKTALGPDNWDEYVYLMERLHYNEISAHEFDSRAKSIFQVFSEKTRKKLNNILVMKMILPRLAEIELEGRGRTTKSVENN
ncbi:hypothetical protein AA0114_g3874 [Alternaria tenuissima]|uniref:Uncharacterized protein n=1 Tax=Alternaria tenuissima TaxID=119927 RepID=A0A4Q4MLL5_9PLEO|nr:hypothetical protein AA0114_g3874 [Alternaria tenuissima]